MFALIAYGTPPLLRAARLKDDPVAYGLALGALSGVAGVVAFFAARSIRLHSPSAFGLRGTRPRWFVIAIGAGIVVWVLSRAITVLYTVIFGAPENVQATYVDAASGGIIALILSTLFLAVLTPVGEELLFRGVVTSVMLHWGWFVGVIGSAVIFAAFHGLNLAIVPAPLTGIVNAELLRRSKSIWPGVIVHVVNNVLANLAATLLTSSA